MPQGHPAVALAAGSARPWFSRVGHGLLVLRPGFTPGDYSQEELQNFVRTGLDPYDIQRRMALFDALPLPRRKDHATRLAPACDESDLYCPWSQQQKQDRRSMMKTLLVATTAFLASRYSLRSLPFRPTPKLPTVIRIGVLNDRSGGVADLAGEGSVVAARMAVEDFGGTVGGAKIEVVFADHQNKADIAASITAADSRQQRRFMSTFRTPPPRSRCRR